ncbi:hypothetical protein MKW94_008987 [Papaver nudicaule]|uniref:Uncharacterized protein n=1 Tax=Papaver nudicaule TaxID=74823 RepID=A0AA42APY1_PAPNU|nr:hypothetical protein [Papaver nudicaule]
MQNGRLPEEVPKRNQIGKKKLKMESFPALQQQGGENLRRVQHPLPQSIKSQKSKRKVKMEVSPSPQQPERSTSDSLPDSSQSGNDYRALRRRYLLLEEESFGLGRELTEVEGEVKNLEEEKHALLDQLVVLEGLIGPSELQHRLPPAIL